MMDDTNSNDTVPWRLYLAGGFVFILFLILVLRLATLQLLDEEGYKQSANTQSRRLVIIPAPRGNIYDRAGHLLVGNRPAHNVVADVAALQNEMNEELTRLRREERAARRAAVPGENGKLSRARDDELREIAPVNVLQQYLDKVNRVIGRQETLDAKAVIQHLTKLSRTRAIPITIVRDLTEAELARFMEQVPVDYPLRIASESIRTYPYGTTAAHVLGYVRSDRGDLAAMPELSAAAPEVLEFFALSEEARKQHMLKGFAGQEAVAGVEASFDKDILQGIPGHQLWTVRPNGYALEQLTGAPPRQGKNLYLSLDVNLQRTAEQALAQRFPGYFASVIALDVKTGEILVCANAPSFDPTRIQQTAYYKEFLKSGSLFNRATRIALPPGSSFKPITAIAALRAGVINPDTIKDCGAYFEIGRRKYIEHDRNAFGRVNLVRMLQVSSNVYCYQVALDTGIEKLAAEARRFGLDQPTTLEISQAPASRLIIPTPEYKRKRTGEGWALGDTANFSIGQGSMQTTLMHLTSMFASIARNETRTAISIIHDPARSSGRDHHGEPIGLPPDQYQAIIDGLVACASPPNGTGRSVAGYGNYSGIQRLGGLSVASKTGTAQVSNNTANLAWVLAFAPVENPQIAIGVLIEGKPGDTNFGGGTNAGPIANSVLLEWRKRYFSTEIKAPEVPAAVPFTGYQPGFSER
ncbi:MAG: hypothetical protein LBV54_08015 [Puniceicoccales bacterium]|jgi:penicillin-binding protein 2|nr:hypothetical protein [Puniceicoccales bacterium]